MAIKSLKLQKEPIITSTDISIYRIVISDNDSSISSHLMTLEDEINRKLRSDISPYVVKVGDERIYIGEYWPQIMSIIAQTVTMINMSDHCWITATANCRDELNDTRIVQSLEKGGVEIIYDTVGEYTAQ